MSADLPVPRLALLIPRLATEHDGEVVATVRAMGRTLKSSGHDFHDLAQRLAGTELWLDTARIAGNWREVVVWLRAHRHRLTEREDDFVASLEMQMSRGRGPTVRQASWLNDIYFKIIRGRP